jgi:single-stranded-DNA-specific exonuclease
LRSRGSMHRRWLLQKTNPEFVHYLSSAASISPLLAKILIHRGVKTAEAVRDFLNPGISGLSDPYELPGMKAAVERIRSAALQGERVLVHGDYDTDGLTAAAIMVSALRKIGLHVHYFIPHRMVHGYGFNAGSVEKARNLGLRLIITVDCGIVSFDAAACAKREGIDLIITDHHEPLRKRSAATMRDAGPVTEEAAEVVLPDALAVVNPKLMTRDSNLRNLSGAGIAFKVAQALGMHEELRFTEEDLLSLLDLAALGTIADVVPFTGENRIIIGEGMKHIRNGRRPAIKALKEACGLGGRELRAVLLSFTMVPRINAAGRLGDSEDVVRLLLSENEEEAVALSMWLDGLNAQRQRIEEGVYQEALSMIDRSLPDSVIILAGEGWHQGVVGVVAARIAEQFYRPAVIFSVDNGVAKGSARSIPGFDICRAFSDCSDLLLDFGGHKQAAGVRIESANLGPFRERMRAIFDSLQERAVRPEIKVDADVRLSDIKIDVVRELSLLEPVGEGNPEPLLGARMIEVVSPRIVGNNHIKMRLCQKSCQIEAIGFAMGNLMGRLEAPSALDVVFTPAINEWRGARHLQLIVKAFRPSV